MITRVLHSFSRFTDRFLSLKRSFKFRLVAWFCILSIIPVILIQMIFFYNIAGILQNNIDTLENTNLVQTRKIIRTKLDFYEDLLYQMYTDDRIIELIDKLNAGDDIEFYSSQLRRMLHSYVYTMPYVQSITVLTSSGKMVFDDLLTGYNTKTSWLDVSGGQPARLFGSIVSGDDTKFLSSQLASFFSSKKYYLFHLAHRVVDYKNIWKKNGVVILSVDEKMLSEICDEKIGGSRSNAADNQVFIIDRHGTVISFPDESKIGVTLDLPPEEALRKEAIRRLVSGDGAGVKERLSVYELDEQKTGWSVIAVRDQSAVYRQISGQQHMTIFVVLLSIAALIVIIYFITERLTRSVNTVVLAMNRAGLGELSVRIDKDGKMPLEMEKIADNFNLMIIKLNALIDEVQTASSKQRDAEISALEAQVNPHFLYNTLDTINWMAIDKEQFEISNAINTLAQILRYGIDNSNKIVEIRQEAEWLRQYVFLQQTRLKNTFECSIDIDPAVMSCHIHKLLFQPFVENSIVHGFKGLDRSHTLTVAIGRADGKIAAVIADNGRGIEPDTVRKLNEGSSIDTDLRNHIGIRNAIERIKMYYGYSSDVSIESVYGEGTRITIVFPEIRAEIKSEGKS